MKEQEIALPLYDGIGPSRTFDRASQRRGLVPPKALQQIQVLLDFVRRMACTGVFDKVEHEIFGGVFRFAFAERRPFFLDPVRELPKSNDVRMSSLSRLTAWFFDPMADVA
jgi:hypothetical protein